MKLCPGAPLKLCPGASLCARGHSFKRRRQRAQFHKGASWDRFPHGVYNELKIDVLTHSTITLSQMMCTREFSCGGEGFHVEAKKGVYHELYLRWGHVTSKLYLDEAYSTFRRFSRSSIMTNNSDRYSSYFTYPLIIYRYSIL